MRRLAVVVLAALVLSGCGSSPANWYANGKQYAIADYKAGDTAKLVGVTPQKWCATDLADFGGSSSNSLGVPLNGPSTSNTSAVRQWVNGCVAGYNAAP